MPLQIEVAIQLRLLASLALGRDIKSTEHIADINQELEERLAQVVSDAPNS